MDVINTRMNPKLKDGRAPSTAGHLIYAIGDIHGSYELLKMLLTKIVEDAKVQAAGRRPILIFCGDYVDRGCQSPAVLELLISLARRRDIDVRTLKGNHEEALIGFINAPERSSSWLGFGGDETLAAYGIPVPSVANGRKGLRDARDALLGIMPAAHYRFLQELDVMIIVGDYTFVHAGVRPGVSLKDQKESDLLWIRQEFLDNQVCLNSVIVHGHSWRSHDPEVTPNRIGIDTGGYKTGVLTAVRLDDTSIEFLQAGVPARYTVPDQDDNGFFPASERAV